ncbi:hypothetical protein K469DRAFT_763342 [Zopfia rhizophila CBS 207.26]|uniref:Transcription factor domain-containing protein n=1 Tax=Zopfia rhizophila CBS 207.26 TaxID=1314779 RepID=A0A6A6DD03_9PEZI|nr:hypothetical protein K469DRAFT_763342 [Zopfia rhizophila CBS 207.26]
MQEGQYGNFHGGASEFAFLHFAKKKLASLPSMSIHFSDYPLAGSGTLPSILPPKPVADDLIRNYFDFGLIPSRFVHKPSLLECYERLYSCDHSEGFNQDSAALAYMAMAIGSHYSKLNNMFCDYSASDRMLSSIFGCLCAIHDDDVDQDECALANNEDNSVSACRVTENGTFCSVAALVHYVRVARIFGRILREFYSPAAKLHTITRLHEAAIEFERFLMEWQGNLPTLLLYRPFILYSMGSNPERQSRVEQWIKRCHGKSIEAANMVVSECRYLYQRGLFSGVFWMVNYVQFAAVGTLYMYSHLCPEAAHVRGIAEEAMAQFPIGVDGDLVGQRYVEILNKSNEGTAGTNVTTASWADPASRAWWDEELPEFDASLMYFGGLWSNLFFDTVMLDEYMGGGIGRSAKTLYIIYHNTRPLKFAGIYYAAGWTELALATLHWGKQASPGVSFSTNQGCRLCPKWFRGTFGSLSSKANTHIPVRNREMSPSRGTGRVFPKEEIHFFSEDISTPTSPQEASV